MVGWNMTGYEEMLNMGDCDIDQWANVVVTMCVMLDVADVGNVLCCDICGIWRCGRGCDMGDIIDVGETFDIGGDVLYGEI